MIISESVKILGINETNEPMVSDIIYNDTKIVIPANSFLFTELIGIDDEPIYELCDLNYTQINNVGSDEEAIFQLSSTELLDAEIANRISTIPEHIDYCDNFSNVKGSRVLHIVQHYRNARTGEKLQHDWRIFRDELEKRSTVGEYVIYVHERDVYTREDVKKHLSQLRKEYARLSDTSENGLDEYIKLHQKIFEGNPKSPHIHIPIRGKLGNDGKRQPISADLVAKWLNISPSCCKYVIDNSVKGGDDGFLDAIDYGDHADEKSQLLGKTLYDESVYVACKEGFDWKQALADRDTYKEEYGIDSPTQLQRWKQDLLKGRKTLNDCYEENIDLYADNIQKLERWRNDYVSKRCPLPPMRQTFYIEAESAQGGEGKSVCTHALAKLLASEYGADVSKPYYELNDYIFNCNDSKVAMQHYDGQPIIVLNEMKAGDMMVAFGGRRGVKELLDPFQESKSSYNVKFGDCCVVARYIIINGIQSSEEFKDQLAKAKDVNDDTSEDKAMKQFNRRIWGGIKIIDDEQIAIMFQMKWLDPTAEKYRYEEICRLRTNWARLREKYTGQALYDCSKQRLQPLIDKIDETYEMYRDENKISSSDDILDEDLIVEILPPVQTVPISVEENNKIADSQLYELLTQNPKFKDIHLSILSFLANFKDYTFFGYPSIMSGIPYVYYDTAYRWYQEGREISYYGDAYEDIRYTSHDEHYASVKLSEEEFVHRNNIRNQYHINNSERMNYCDFLERYTIRFEEQLEEANYELAKIQKKKKPSEYDIRRSKRHVEKARQQLDAIRHFTFDDYCEHKFDKLYPMLNQIDNSLKTPI